jgi:ribosomal protein S18 acetylase RimI-like enzyme
VHVASWHANYRGLVPDEQIEARSLDVRRDQWRKCFDDPARITLVAQEREQIQGFASALLIDAKTHGFESYLQTLYLLPEVQGRGIGRDLLRELARRLRERGITSMALRTLRLNRARTFYERLGARLVPEGIANDAGQFDDVVYAFDDIRVLE